MAERRRRQRSSPRVHSRSWTTWISAPVIASLKQPGESTEDALARVKGELVGNFSDAIDALERAIQALPDQITDPGLFKLPGLAVAAVSSFRGAIQAVTNISGLVTRSRLNSKRPSPNCKGMPATWPTWSRRCNGR